MSRSLSSLLNRTRASLLVLLVVVLSLQSVVQLVAGIHGHRHMHTGAVQAAKADGGALAAITRPLRAVLDQLHAGQDPRLSMPGLTWSASKGSVAGMHQHGGVFHTHSADTHDVVDVGDAGDDGLQAGATAFLAWLPSAPVLMAGQGGDCPVGVTTGWRDCVVAPPQVPPRG